MLLFVAALIAATFASGAWCVAEILPGRVRAWWLTGRPVTASAVVLGAVVSVAAGLRFFLVPSHHAMYVDEPWYAEAACNLARFGRLVVCQETWSGRVCVPYAKAWGWPMLMAPWMLLVGCGTSVGIHMNQVLGSATVLLVALATRCAGGRWWQAIFAAAILAIHPVHVAWSATGETNVSAAATLLVGLCGALVYVRRGRWCGAALAVSGLGLSTAIRPESLLPALVSAVILALAARTKPGQRLLVAGAIGMVSFGAAASGLMLWTMNESISSGAFLSFGNILRNMRLITYAERPPIQGVVMLVAFAGAVVLARAHERGAAWLLLCTGVAGALGALAYDRFHERMLLGATVALLPLSGFLFDWRAPLATERRRPRLGPLAAGSGVFVLVLLWAHALLSTSAAPETQVLETRIVSRLARLPFASDALFIAEQPPVVAAAGMAHVMATGQALENEAEVRRLIADGRPIYFLCDMYCEPGFQGAPTPAMCSQMLAHFALSPVAEERFNSRSYILYRTSGPARPGSPPPECPIVRRWALD